MAILGRHIGRLYFDPDDPIYADHFPGAPVVPGTLIIDAFLTRVGQMGIAATGLKRFRFKAFARPGVYVYELEITEGAIQCRLLHEGRETAVGTILYAHG